MLSRAVHVPLVTEKAKAAVEDWQQQKFDPPHGDTDRGRWQVHLAVSSAEREAIARAAPGVVPAENFELHAGEDESDPEGDMTLALRVFADSSEDAVGEARHAYSRIREAAGLESSPAAVLGYISPWWHQRSRAEHVAKEAHELHRQGRHDLAVVRIQTYCEMRVADTLTELIQDRHPGVDSSKLFRRPTSLMDDQSRTLLHLLTGRRIQDEAWWSEYVDHVRRRNAIVHRGLEVDRDESYASLKVAVDLGTWLLDARQEQQGPIAQ